MKRQGNKTILDKLAKNHACCVLLTCDEPSEDGQMQVEMLYEGDAALAAYLLQGALSRLDEEEGEEMIVGNMEKIQYID